VVLAWSFVVLFIQIALTVETDWRQFVPDTLSGFAVSAVVGAVVAHAVIRTEAANAKSSARQAASLQWQPVKAQMLRAHYPAAVNATRTPLTKLANYTDEWLDVYKEHPMETWSLALPDERMLELVAQLRTSVPLLIKASRKLYDAIGQAALAVYRAPGIEPDARIVETLRGHVMDAIRGVVKPSEVFEEAVMVDFKSAMRQKVLKDALQVWRSRLTEVTAQDAELRSLLE
jgi:hypothetical protein